MGNINNALLGRAKRRTLFISNAYRRGQRDAFLPLLLGSDAFTIEARPGEGHRHDIVLEAIHECYRTDGVKGKYDQAFQDSLMILIDRIHNPESAATAMEYYLMELEMEKLGVNAFTIDKNKFYQKISDRCKDCVWLRLWIGQHKAVLKEYQLNFG